MSIPPLVDHHSHPLLYASFSTAVNLGEVQSLDEAKDLLNDASKHCDIVVGHGWKDNFFSFDEETLSTLPPCAIFNLSLHHLLVNESGREILGQNFGSAVHKIDDRDWYESNLRDVLNWFAKLNGSPEAIISFYENLNALGVYSCEEMLLVDGQEIDWFEETGFIERTKIWAAPDTFQQLSAKHQEQVCGLKLFTDGAIGSWTAALSKPFRYPAGQTPVHPNLGMLMYSDAELAKTIMKCAELASHEKGIAIHAIGDRAIEQTLKTLETFSEQDLENFETIRIEHAQLISRSQAERAKRLNITLSMQPNFSIDSVDYADRLPAGMAEQNNPFRMLIDEVGFGAGEDLIFGSDGMPHGVEFATQQAFQPTLVNQILTRSEFISGYCS